jgi:hypothetical protein
MLNIKSLLFALTLPALAAFAADQAPAPSTLYNGISLKPAGDTIQKDSSAHQVFIDNPHFESDAQYFPMASDDDTALAACLLLGGSKLVRYNGAAGEIQPTDVLAYSDNKLETAATKLGLDPEAYAAPVIADLTCGL